MQNKEDIYTRIILEDSNGAFLGFLLLVVSFIVGAAFQAFFDFPFFL